jgi:hypothetical protein
VSVNILSNTCTTGNKQVEEVKKMKNRRKNIDDNIPFSTEKSDVMNESLKV